MVEADIKFDLAGKFHHCWLRTPVHFPHTHKCQIKSTWYRYRLQGAVYIYKLLRAFTEYDVANKRAILTLWLSLLDVFGVIMLLYFAAAAFIGHYWKGWNFAAGWILFLDSKKNTNVENWRLSLITQVLSCLVHDATSEVVPRIEVGATTICVKIERIRLSKYCAAYYTVEHKPPKKWREIFK